MIRYWDLLTCRSLSLESSVYRDQDQDSEVEVGRAGRQQKGHVGVSPSLYFQLDHCGLRLVVVGHRVVLD